jgi:multidrug efflux pump subunit AcrA (membrane-fusion protein)
MTITFHAAPPAASPATASHLTHVGNKEIRKACTKTIQDGYVNAQIQPQVSGYLVKQSYKEGSYVRKDRFFEIHPRPFQAILDQAEVRLAQSQPRVDTEPLKHMGSQFQARGCDAIARPLLFRLTDRIRSEAEPFALHPWQMV